MGLVKLITCNSSIDAQIIKSKLESENVKVFLINENFTNLLPMYNNMLGAGIQIMVSNLDFRKSIEILSQMDHFTCPICGGKEFKIGLGKNRTNKVIAAILSLFVAVPLGNIQSERICVNCNNES